MALPAGMSLMTQVGLVLKTITKDFNIAALVRITVLQGCSSAPRRSQM